MQYTAQSIPSALAIALALLVGSAAGAQPAPQCAPTREPGIERCVLGLPAPLLARMNEPQQRSNWCWAAVIHMVLSRYGVDIPQERIVEAHFGRSVNEGVAPQVLAELLNRTWRDEAGRALRVNARAVPSWWRSFGVTAPDVLEDLAAERPVVLAMPTHAVVLVQLVYERSPAGSEPTGAIRLVRGVVLDPASAHGLRSLRPDELRPELLARVSAEPMADAPQGPAPAALEQAQPGRAGHAYSEGGLPQPGDHSMPPNLHVSETLMVRIRAHWVHLTDEDVRHGLKHRDNFLERLRHRHNLGLDEAEAQLHAFEQKNPELLFEKS